MKIYISSSIDNLREVIALTHELEARGNCVYKWHRYLPAPEFITEEIKNSDDTGEIFRFCLECCAHADLVVYLGPSGQDSAFELGIAYNAGVPIIGLLHEDERLGVMLKRVFYSVVHSTEELLDKIKTFPRSWQ